jgi:pyroglutamyl-peptidase
VKRAALAVVVAALVPLAVPANGQQGGQDTPPPVTKRRVLITAFEPFEGREENNSMRIAAVMKAHPELFQDIELTVCTLPVVYDEAAKKALACLDAMPEKPDAVISLGETGCKIQLETSAGNQDNGFGPDNAGNIRSNHTIIEGGPARIGYDLPMQAMYCTLTAEQRKAVEPSTTMNYVCNNTAYNLASKLRGTGIQFGFVHVPTTASYCGAASDPDSNARLIAQMMNGAFAHQRTERPTTYALPHCSNDEALPTSLDELRRVTESIDEAEEAVACEKEYLEKLKELIR